MVYFRKYRPQTLEALIGQEHIVDSLTKAYKSNRLAQAYLFCGPKGTGKTSTARILAKMVNCKMVGSRPSALRPLRLEEELGVGSEDQKSPNPELQAKRTPDIPCNQCSSCISITDGSNLDLIEIDAASNRGIDDIRDLREKIKLAPTTGRKKVYIIDEVHMLSNEAFNAFLKTLEEPPDHVLFVLATTEVHKIPETILSRVQRLDFKIATQKDLYKALKNVVDAEKLKIDEEALFYLAKKASGSFRDGIKFLDQLANDGEKITLEKAEQALKSSDFIHLISVLDSVFKSDAASSLSKVLEQVELGVNIKEYIFSMMDLLRMMLFIKQGLTSFAKEDLGTEKFMEIDELAKHLTLNNLLKTLDIFQEALEKMKTASIISLPLEVAIVESSMVQSSDKAVVGTKENVVQITHPVTDDNKLIDNAPDINVLKDKWNYVLETVRPYNYSLEAMLKLVKILECRENLVILEVPYSFHQRILDVPKSKSLLEGVLSEVLGKSITVSTVLGKSQVKKDELANVEVAADDEVIRIAAEIFSSESVT